MRSKIVLSAVVTVCMLVCFWGGMCKCLAGEHDDWNLLNRDSWFDNYIVNATTGLYTEKNGYSALEMIPLSGGSVCAIYLPDGNNAHLVYYDEKQVYIGGEILSAAKGALVELPEKCAFVTLSMARSEIRNSFFVQDDFNDTFVVAKNRNTRFATVKAAVAAIGERGTVIVMPGTYTGNVQAWGKNVNLIGVDRETCILENHSSSYSAPPLEISAGIVKNVTIKARGTNAEGRGAGNTEPGAYGVHVEDNGLYGNLLKFENCYIYSDYNSAVGMGMRGGCRVQFIDSHLKGKEFGLFCHDSAGKNYSGVQNLSMIRCTIEGMQGSGAVRFDSQGTTGATVNVLFVDTVLKNQNVTGVPAKNSKRLLSTRNNGGRGTDDNWMGLKNYFLDEDSMGNSVMEMDY